MNDGRWGEEQEHSGKQLRVPFRVTSVSAGRVRYSPAVSVAS